MAILNRMAADRNRAISHRKIYVVCMYLVLNSKEYKSTCAVHTGREYNWKITCMYCIDVPHTGK